MEEHVPQGWPEPLTTDAKRLLAVTLFGIGIATLSILGLLVVLTA